MQDERINKMFNSVECVDSFLFFFGLFFLNVEGFIEEMLLS